MAKKSSAKRNPTSGMEKQEARRQRLETRRQAKLEAIARARRAQQRERMVRFVVIGFIVAAFVWFIFLRTQTPTEFDGIQVAQFSTAGTNQHTNETVNYQTRPPVSGEHAPAPFPCGIYSETVRDENQVHMLEHGAVGIQYLPTLDPSEIAAIEGIVGEFDENVFSAPYPEMQSPIAVTSWSRKMEMDRLNETAVRDYIDTFAGEGPEPGQNCPSESDTPFQPQASPEPSAVPEPSTEPDGGGGKDGKGKKGDGKKGDG